MPSLRKAIDDKCKDCGYHESNGGTWRQQVEECRVFRCPLYEVRPKAYVSRLEINGNGLNSSNLAQPRG